MSGARRCWQYNETKTFFNSWKSHVYMYRFLKKHSNKSPLHSAICKDLQKAGYTRSLKEVMFKMKNFRRSSLMAQENRISGYRWYNEVEEILKLEKIEQEHRQAAGIQTKQASKLPYEQNVDGNTPEFVEIVTSDHKDENDSDPNLLSPTVIKHAETEVPNNIQTNVPQLSGSNSKKSAETILLNICREFRSSNREHEANDIALLELVKEQNDIFRKQARLLLKLL